MRRLGRFLETRLRISRERGLRPFLSMILCAFAFVLGSMALSGAAGLGGIVAVFALVWLSVVAMLSLGPAVLFAYVFALLPIWTIPIGYWGVAAIWKAAAPPQRAGEEAMLVAWCLYGLVLFVVALLSRKPKQGGGVGALASRRSRDDDLTPSHLRL